MIYPELVERKNELVKLYTENVQKFYKELASWAINTPYIWQDFEVQALPAKPQMVKDYEMLPPISRKNVKSSFWEEPEVKLYYDQFDMIFNKNIRNRKFLEQCLKDISDVKDKIRVTDRIFEFRERGF